MNLNVVAPMPGIVKEVTVRQGDQVKRGQRLAVLEAMKMENEILAKENGTVRSCRAEAGMSVEKGELIMELTQ
jgi:3-methylcrotonyl-CoA carboxylase alpha subunit